MISSEMSIDELISILHQAAYYNFVKNPDVRMKKRKQRTTDCLAMLFFKMNSENQRVPRLSVTEVKQKIGEIHYRNIQYFANKNKLSTDTFNEIHGRIVGMLLEDVMSKFQSDEHVQLLVREATIAKKLYEAVQSMLQFMKRGGKDDAFYKTLKEDEMNSLLRNIELAAVKRNYMPSIETKGVGYTEDDSNSVDSGLTKFHERLVREFGGKYNHEEKKTSGVRQKLEEYYSSLGGENGIQEYTIDDAQKQIAEIAREIWIKQDESYSYPYTVFTTAEDEIREYEKSYIIISDNLLIRDSHTSFNINAQGDEIYDLLHPKIPEEKNKNPEHGNPYWQPDEEYPVFDLNSIDEEKQRKMAEVQQKFYNIFTNSVHMARRCYYVWRADAAHTYVEKLFETYSDRDKEIKKAEKYKELGLHEFDLDTHFLTRLDQLIDDEVRIGYQDSEYQFNMENLIRDFLPSIAFEKDKDYHTDYSEFNEKWAEHHDSLKSDRIMAAVQKLCQIRMKARQSKKRGNDPYDPEKSHIIFAASQNPYLVIPDKPLMTSSTYVV